MTTLRDPKNQEFDEKISDFNNSPVKSGHFRFRSQR